MLELRRIVAGLVQQRCVCFDFAARHRQFARQSDTASAFLFERVTMLPRARRQLSSRGGRLLHEGGRFFALLSEQLCGLRGLRPQLQIEPTPGLGKLIRQSLCTLLPLQGSSCFRYGRLRGRLDLCSLLRPRLRAGLIGFGVVGKRR